MFYYFAFSRDVIEVALCRCILFSHTRLWTVHIVYGLNKRETFRNTNFFFIIILLIPNIHMLIINFCQDTCLITFGRVSFFNSIFSFTGLRFWLKHKLFDQNRIDFEAKYSKKYNKIFVGCFCCETIVFIIINIFIPIMSKVDRILVT